MIWLVETFRFPKWWGLGLEHFEKFKWSSFSSILISIIQTFISRYMVLIYDLKSPSRSIISSITDIERVGAGEDIEEATRRENVNLNTKLWVCCDWVDLFWHHCYNSQYWFFMKIVPQYQKYVYDWSDVVRRYFLNMGSWWNLFLLIFWGWWKCAKLSKFRNMIIPTIS